MLLELSHLQEVVVQLEKHTADPYMLPPASEQVLYWYFLFRINFQVYLFEFFMYF